MKYIKSFNEKIEKNKLNEKWFSFIKDKYQDLNKLKKEIDNGGNKFEGDLQRYLIDINYLFSYGYLEREYLEKAEKLVDEYSNIKNELDLNIDNDVIKIYKKLILLKKKLQKIKHKGKTKEAEEKKLGNFSINIGFGNNKNSSKSNNNLRRDNSFGRFGGGKFGGGGAGNSW